MLDWIPTLNAYKASGNARAKLPNKEKCDAPKGRVAFSTEANCCSSYRASLTNFVTKYASIASLPPSEP